MSTDKKSVLFICLGNICRSPIAEAVFRHLAVKKGVSHNWDIDSGAIGEWHVGNPPDVRARNCMKKYNISMDHRARQICTEDFSRFQFILGMDDENLYDINSISPPGHKASIEMLGDYDPEGDRIIRDPYYDDNDAGFHKCYQQCMRCCEAFLNKHS